MVSLIERFERYLSVAGITSDDQKVNTCFYAIGPQAEDVMDVWTCRQDLQQRNTTSSEPSLNRTIVRRNVIYERARFNFTVQKDKESIKTFLTDLYALIENCEYGDFKEPLLCDRIVVGIRDKKLCEQLQLDDQLSLKTVLAKVRSKEMITKGRSGIGKRCVAQKLT